MSHPLCDKGSRINSMALHTPVIRSERPAQSRPQKIQNNIRRPMKRGPIPSHGSIASKTAPSAPFLHEVALAPCGNPLISLMSPSEHRLRIDSRIKTAATVSVWSLNPTGLAGESRKEVNGYGGGDGRARKEKGENWR
jgi:hypothetical protein